MDGNLIIIIAAGGGLLISIVAQLVAFLILVKGWIDKALATHYFHEHVLDRGTGETVLRRLDRCDSLCPVKHPSQATGSSGRYEHIHGRQR